jgi:hypothetical protein
MWSSVSTSGINVDGLNSVSGSATGDVWTVGFSGNVARWNGQAWTELTSGTPNSLFGVWAVSATDAWMVGLSGPRRWNGTSWSAVPAPMFGTLNAVHGAGTNAWAVGEMGRVYRWVP